MLSCQSLIALEIDVLSMGEIESATLYRLNVPMKTSYRAAIHDFSVMDSVLICLQSADGTRGIGTADPSPGYSRQTTVDIWKALSESVLPLLLNEQPDNPSEAASVLNQIDDHENATCAAEMACLDLYGRLHGKPVSTYLGGRKRKQENLNAWVGIDDPTAMAEEAAQWCDRGFQSLKLKLSGDSQTDIARVRTVADRVGDAMQIRADVNGAYDKETAISVVEELEDVPLSHLEQPVPQDDLDGLQAVTESSSTAVMADECLTSFERVREVIDREAADRLKLKPLRLGGFMETKKVLEAASERNMDCVIGHGFGLSPATSAEIQLTISHENIFRPIESVGFLKMENEPFDATFVYESGEVKASTDHGLGITVVEGELSEYTTERREIS